MKFRIVFLICLWGWMVGNSSAADLSSVDFTHVSINEGLSQSTIFSIVQDLKGNMWFATYDGLNKYDGYDFTVYRHSSDNPEYSLANDIVRVLEVDDDGKIWVGTQKGLSCYDEEQDCFRNFSLKPDVPMVVSGIVELPEKKLLVNADYHVQLFDRASCKFLENALPESLRNLKVASVKLIGDKVYIGTCSQGIYVYHFRTGMAERFPHFYAEVQVQDMLQSNDSQLWIATEGEGLYAVDLKTGESRHYLHEAGSKNGLSSNYVRSLSFDSEGRLWVGTFNDLNIYVDKTDSFVSYTSSSVDPRSLSQRSVRCIFKDSQGGMWLGTYFGGLNYYHPLKNRFYNIRHVPYRNSLSDNVVSCIVEDEDSNLWIGTNDGGVNYYSTKTGQFVYYPLNTGKTLLSNMESNNVKAIYIDERRNRVYIGMHAGGLKILDRVTGRIDYFNISPNVPGDIYSLLLYEDGQLLAGTLEGLYLFDMERRTFALVSSDSKGNSIPRMSAFVLFKDSSGRLWIGGTDGLRIFGTEHEGVKGLYSMPLPSPEFSAVSEVQCVFESAKKEIWIATRLGLYRWNDEKEGLEHYTTDDGLPNNVVYGIEEDSYGCIWISTNKGLSCFNPNTGRFRNFTANDGLQSNQFNTYSHCRTKNGVLYFGGINGITAFRPELLLDNPYAPSPVITGLRVSNRKIMPGDDTGILSKNICDTKSIVLDHSQRMFTLDYVVSNYISGQHNTFAYCLEGYDGEWFYSQDVRSVTYTNLPSGKYRFLVKAANSDGKWCQNPVALDITILPVWYCTWWACLMFVLAGMLLLYWLFKHWEDRKNMQMKLEMERQEKQHQEEISQMKFRFFINISHELRTPLTLIVAPVKEMLTRTTDKWFRSQLQYVEKNANRLLFLVNQLMDYRWAELGVFKLQVGKVNVYRQVKENYLYYEKLARSRGLNYTLQSDLEGQELLVDSQYLDLIENNLLSNAFKYTQEGSIAVRLTLSGADMLLEVSDTGVGIPEGVQGRVFERFFQLENTHMGSGIGLSLVHRLVELHHGHIELTSKEGKGSVFSVYLPQSPEAYSPEEMKKDGEGETAKQVYSVNSKAMFFADTEREADKAEEPGETKKYGKVLVVEDNEDIRRYLREGLSEQFTVVEAGNGEEALQKLKEGDLDLVITDVMMPVMDGIKLCRHIKQDLSTSHIPVIMLSAKNDVSDKMEGFQIGADDYISKPFSLSLLVSKVQNMMRTRIRMKEYYKKTTEIQPEKITFNAMDEELLTRAMNVVKENMDNSGFSAEDFAKAMNMSRSNLHLKLKGITGESAVEFIRKIRMNEAVRLLKDGRYSIAEISTMVGYNTPSYFAQSFKKYFGYMPSEYFKRNK